MGSYVPKPYSNLLSRVKSMFDYTIYPEDRITTMTNFT